ncbi:MAG: hypothetical protein AAGA65_28640, partial [Actinomycetota bacterium]
TGVVEDETFSWELDTGREQKLLAGPAIARSVEGRTVLVTGDRAEIHATRGNVGLIQSIETETYMTEMAESGGRLLVAGGRYASLIVEGRSSSPGPLPGASLPRPQVIDVALSEDGRYGAAVWFGGGREATVWDLDTREPIDFPSYVVHLPIAADFSGDRLVVGFGDGFVGFYDVAGSAGAEQLDLVDTGLGRVVDVVATADAVYAVGSRDPESPANVIRLEIDGSNLSAGPLVEVGAVLGVQAVAAVLSDGSLAVGFASGNLVILTEELEPIAEQNLGLIYVDDLTEIPALDRLIVSGRLRSPTIDTRTYAVVDEVQFDPAGIVTPGVYSASAEVLITPSIVEYAGLDVWSLADVDLRARACQAIGRDITEDEWHTYVGDDIPHQPVCAAYRNGSGNRQAAIFSSAPVASVDPFTRSEPTCDSTLPLRSGLYSLHRTAADQPQSDFVAICWRDEGVVALRLESPGRQLDLATARVVDGALLGSPPRDPESAAWYLAVQGVDSTTGRPGALVAGFEADRILWRQWVAGDDTVELRIIEDANIAYRQLAIVADADTDQSVMTVFTHQYGARDGIFSVDDEAVAGTQIDMAAVSDADPSPELVGTLDEPEPLDAATALQRFIDTWEAEDWAAMAEVTSLDALAAAQELYLPGLEVLPPPDDCAIPGATSADCVLLYANGPGFALILYLEIEAGVVIEVIDGGSAG